MKQCACPRTLPSSASRQRPPEVTFRLVRELADNGIPVAAACRVLSVSTSGYYKWLRKPESPRNAKNRALVKLIAAIHDESRGPYGWPRVHAELVLGLGEMVNRKRVTALGGEARLA